MKNICFKNSTYQVQFLLQENVSKRIRNFLSRDIKDVLVNEDEVPKYHVVTGDFSEESSHEIFRGLDFSALDFLVDKKLMYPFYFLLEMYGKAWRSHDVAIYSCYAIYVRTHPNANTYQRKCWYLVNLDPKKGNFPEVIFVKYRNKQVADLVCKRDK